MNYTLIYNNLMNRAKLRTLQGYVEKHHIVPRCMGGGDESENIAILTAEEHYLAHQLLVKIYPTNRSLIYAAAYMTVDGQNGNRINNKLYGWLRRKNSKVRRTFRHTAESKRKITEAQLGRPSGMKGKIHSEASRKKMSEVHKGVPRTPEVVAKFRQRKQSEETKEKIRQANLGKKYTEEFKKKLSDAHKGKRFTEEEKAAMRAKKLEKQLRKSND